MSSNLMELSARNMMPVAVTLHGGHAPPDDTRMWEYQLVTLFSAITGRIDIHI
jgi:hypothetical protein